METPVFSTASTILTQVRAETKIGSNPISTALQDTAMLRVLNDVNAEFVNYPYNIGMNGWKFLRREILFNTIASTTLNGALSSGATSIVLTSGTGWDSPSTSLGSGYIKSGVNSFDFFQFESRSGATLSIVNGIDISHSTLEEVHKIYALPSTFGKPRGLFVDNIEYFFYDQDLRQVPPSRHYTLRAPVSTNNYTLTFCVLPRSIGVHDCTMYFIIEPTTISLTTTSVDAPDGIPRRYIVEKMNAYVWEVLGEFQLAQAARLRADDAIRKSLDQWAAHSLGAPFNIVPNL